MQNPEIGRRAFRAINEMADRRGTTLQAECSRIGINIQHIYRWNKGESPNAAWLEILCRAGYDVPYILKGE